MLPAKIAKHEGLPCHGIDSFPSYLSYLSYGGPPPGKQWTVDPQHWGYLLGAPQVPPPLNQLPPGYSYSTPPSSPPSSPSAKKRPNTYTDKHGQITVMPEPAVKKTKKYKEGAKDYRDSVNKLTGEPIGYWRNYEKMKEQQDPCNSATPRILEKQVLEKHKRSYDALSVQQTAGQMRHI